MALLIKVVFHVKEYRIRNNIKGNQSININLINKQLLKKMEIAKAFLKRFNINLRQMDVQPINKD